jgi:hypothetical protein
MPREERQPFSYGEYTVRKPFRGWGRDWVPGSDFPWRQLTCTKKKLRQLYDHRKIEPKGEPIPADFTEAPVASVEETEEATSEAFVFDPDVHTIDNPERGEWYIKKGSKVLLRVTLKEARRLEKRVTSSEVRPEEIVTEEEEEEV